MIFSIFNAEKSICILHGQVLVRLKNLHSVQFFSINSHIATSDSIASIIRDLLSFCMQKDTKSFS